MKHVLLTVFAASLLSAEVPWGSVVTDGTKQYTVVKTGNAPLGVPAMPTPKHGVMISARSESAGLRHLSIKVLAKLKDGSLRILTASIPSDSGEFVSAHWNVRAEAETIEHVEIDEVRE